MNRRAFNEEIYDDGEGRADDRYDPSTFRNIIYALGHNNAKYFV